MGSSPSSNQKSMINVVNIETPEAQRKDQQQFNTSVQQMKFSKRHDIFKQKSNETKMQLNNALQNLKKNQLLSTIQFKKLQKTEQFGKNSRQKKLSTIKHERYEYRPRANNFSQQMITIKRKKTSEDSNNISSVSSTYVNDDPNKDKSELTDDKRNFKKALQAEVLNHLISNRKKAINSQEQKRKYKNVLDKDEVQIVEDIDGKYENGKMKEITKHAKRRFTNIKSQKLIPNQFLLFNEDGTLAAEQVQFNNH